MCQRKVRACEIRFPDISKLSGENSNSKIEGSLRLSSIILLMPPDSFLSVYYKKLSLPIFKSAIRGQCYRQKRGEILGMPYWMCELCGHCLNAWRPPVECPHCCQVCSFRDVTCYRPECGGEQNVDPLLPKLYSLVT